ncbi:Hypothetical predicted protein [Octopus vulgaris]|uniref:Uncharacterized protein n=1 Tax=Octopus vulgaris TaxID=6645 RepID=A0AA36BYZ8_OCTVU|nr:Hypothetical predicted protein [Octopus vulgaris]
MEPLRRFPKETSPLAVIKRTLAENLRNVEYAPKAGARLVMYLSDEIKDYVKALEFDRYKIVCYVVLGEKKDQDATVTLKQLRAWTEPSAARFLVLHGTAFKSSGNRSHRVE